jgi:hypothetical protein
MMKVNPETNCVLDIYFINPTLCHICLYNVLSNLWKIKHIIFQISPKLKYCLFAISRPTQKNLHDSKDFIAVLIFLIFLFPKFSFRYVRVLVVFRFPVYSEFS